MTDFRHASSSALRSLLEETERRYEQFKAKGLKLDMTRGKPSTEQAPTPRPVPVPYGTQPSVHPDTGEPMPAAVKGGPRREFWASMPATDRNRPMREWRCRIGRRPTVADWARLVAA